MPLAAAKFASMPSIFSMASAAGAQLSSVRSTNSYSFLPDECTGVYRLRIAHRAHRNDLDSHFLASQARSTTPLSVRKPNRRTEYRPAGSSMPLRYIRLSLPYRCPDRYGRARGHPTARLTYNEMFYKMPVRRRGWTDPFRWNDRCRWDKYCRPHRSFLRSFSPRWWCFPAVSFWFVQTVGLSRFW